MRARRTLACGAAVAATFPLLPLAPPAAAAGCRNLSLDESLDRGLRVAVVKADDNSGGPLGKVRVLAQIGSDLPETLTIQPGVKPRTLEVNAKGYIAAVALERTEDGWARAWCDPLNLAEVIRRIEGEPTTVPGGPPIAYAAGAYGGSRVVALDAMGRTVAWDGQAGAGSALAVCPGGGTVVSAGTGPRGASELTVHDAQTLRPRRSVALPTMPEARVLALGCADSFGDTVRVLTAEAERGGRLLDVAGSRVRERPVRALEHRRAVVAGAVPDGFLVSFEEDVALELSLIDFTGRVRRSFGTPDISPVRGTISPDGKLLAFATANISNPRIHLVAYPSGRLLADAYAPGLGTDLGWTPSGDLLVSAGDRFGSSTMTVRYDGALQEKSRSEVENRTEFAVVGEDEVHFGGETIRVIGPGGERLISNLRLTRTTQIVAAGSAGFALEPMTGTAASGDRRSGGGDRSTAALAAAGAAGVLALVVALAWRRRRLRPPSLPA
jgi:hypothetical protein